MKINKPKDGMMWRHTQTVSGNEQGGNIKTKVTEKRVKDKLQES